MRGPFCFVVAIVFGIIASFSAHAETSQIKILIQPGIMYLPLVIMQHDKLLEKQAEKAGLGPVEVSWASFGSGSASMDALVTGNASIITIGATNTLLLWERTRGEVKALTSVAAAPQYLISRDPKVQTIKDFKEGDKIAVPTAKISAQAIMLQMAAEAAFSESGRTRLDPLTVTMGHPDAMAALLNPNLEITAHFSGSPYQEEELKQPGMHVVLKSRDVFGGAFSTALTSTTRKFHDENPKTIAAFYAAFDEAAKLIDTDKRGAIDKYLAVSKEKYAAADLVQIISAPDFIFAATPALTLKLADYMTKTGLLKSKAADWKDYFFSEAHSMPGS